MSEKKDMGFEYRIAQKELEEALNDIARIEGKKPIHDYDWSVSTPPEPPFCSFCGKGSNQVAHMLQGGNAVICDQCVRVCCDLMEF